MVNEYKKLKDEGKTTLIESQAAIPAIPANPEEEKPGKPAVPARYRVEIARTPVEYNITLEEAQKQADDANQLLADIKAL